VRPLKVALLADGLGGLNGVAELYREVLPRLPPRIAVTVVGASHGSATPDVGLAALGMKAPWCMPEVDCLWPKGGTVFHALTQLSPDVVHVTGPGPLGVAGVAAARRLGIPILGSFHTDLCAYAHTRPWSRPVAPLARRITRSFYGAVDVLTAPSSDAACSLATLLRASTRDITILPQGVDSGRFCPRPDPAREPSRRLRVLTVSRLSPEKRLGVALAAERLLRASHESRLIIVGRGPAAWLLRRRADPSVQFRGPLVGGALVGAYQRADVFLLTSPTETCGQVLLEAQACGLPCVVSSRGAASQTIEQGRTGFRVLEETPRGYAGALALLHCPSTRAEMSAAARQLGERRSWDDTARALTEAYAATVGGVRAAELVNPTRFRRRPAA
jgi:glycosyltransferase involved in cell wall biosynthesis